MRSALCATEEAGDGVFVGDDADDIRQALKGASAAYFGNVGGRRADYDSEGLEFESLLARHKINDLECRLKS